MLRDIKVKDKPWGREIWFAETKDYAGKILEIKKGHRYSLQYHEIKEETQYIRKGKVLLTYGENKDTLQEKVINEGECFHVKPFVIHRVEALEDSEIFEVSTNKLDDVVKLDDDYGRSGKGNNEELDKELSQNINI